MNNASRKLIPAVTIGLAVLLFAASLSAQASFIKVDIPFQFVAGDRVLPAGNYQVNIDRYCNRVEIRHSGGPGTYLSAATVLRKGDTDHGMLVFYKYGKAYVLRQVAAAAQTQAYSLPHSKREQELAKAASRVEIAAVQVR